MECMSERAKALYREFLESDFWLELSARRREGVKRCQDCKKKATCLQCHHVRYPSNWYKTTLEDLVVICRRCHRIRHGLASNRRFFPYRKDETFNAYIHRIEHLCFAVRKGKALRERDKRFLDVAVRRFPPTEGDSCIPWRVERLLETNRLMEQGVFNE